MDISTSSPVERFICRNFSLQAISDRFNEK
jgi:hypothetical protein